MAGIILILVDVFIRNDVSSLIAHVIFAYALVLFVDLPLLYSIALGISAWVLMVFCHYTFFRKGIQIFCNKYISKTVIDEMPLDRLIGYSTKVETVDGVQMIRLEGDLAPFKDSSEFDEGTIVRVVSFADGVAVVSEVKN
ncbi:hypothetical protein [Rubritalea profundi]|nr:hypothetical protein [Rubritalea profundi]